MLSLSLCVWCNLGGALLAYNIRIMAYTRLTVPVVLLLSGRHLPCSLAPSRCSEWCIFPILSSLQARYTSGSSASLALNLGYSQGY